MARIGMQSLIQELRRLCNVGTADYTITGQAGTVAYWSDDSLQAHLDRHRRTLRHVALDAQPDFVDGQTVWTEYQLPVWAKHLEQYAEDASAGFRLYDSKGSAIGTADYAINYAAGVVQFSSDQAQAVRYVDFRSYDLNRAAADVWQAKAAHIAQQVTWASDNHQIQQSDALNHCLIMAQQFKALAGPSNTTMQRMDE